MGANPRGAVKAPLLDERELFQLLRSFCVEAGHPVLNDVIDCIDPSSPLESIRRLKELDPRYELSSYEYLLRQFPICLLKKYPFKGNVDARRNAALLTFLEGEDVCRKVNDLLERDLAGENLPLYTSLSKAREICKNILGRLNVERVLALSRFGPGLNRGLRDANLTGAEVKFGSEITLTNNLIPIASGLLKEYSAWDRASLQGWSCRRFQPVEGNKITFVPKDAFTDRTIAIEPLLNSFVQRGIGITIRGKLHQKAGINLIHGQGYNSYYAYLGSKFGYYSTIDIKNASGCISILLVKSLLPEVWFNLMSSFRSEVGIFPEAISKEPHIYEQFSSMGNGFTFELETLIFYALARTVVPETEKVLVYGDDIIVPSRYYHQVTHLLSQVGFAANSNKSFTGDHPFRESCGKDYLRGTLVRPLFIKKEVHDVPSVIELANRIREFAVESACSPGVSGAACIRFRGLWDGILRRIPSRLAKLVSTPPYYPGGLWKGGISRAQDSSGTPKPYMGIVKSPVKQRVLDDDALYAARLYGVLGGQDTTRRHCYNWDVKLIPGNNVPPEGITWGGWL